MPRWGGYLKSSLLFLVWFIALLIIHYGLDRNSFWLVPTYSLAFVAYFAICKNLSFSFRQIVLLALLSRCALFFSAPNLSDDYHRFLWDGLIFEEGYNAYQFKPAEIFEELPDDYHSLYDLLNSQEYNSTYPPLAQYLFILSTRFGVEHGQLGIFILRFILLAFEIGVIWLLTLLSTSIIRVMYYAFNPLVILELTGNLHFEGIVVFFLLLAIWFFNQSLWRSASMALTLGILTKLTPLMFLPLLLKKLEIKKAIYSYLLLGGLIIVLSIPLFNLALYSGMFEGLDLFFRKFEFNSGIFFLVREVGFLLKGYDVVQSAGPFMSVLALVLILIYSFWIVKKDTEYAEAFTVILFIQLMLATTVHPWYIIPLIAFSCISGYLFPIVWSLVIMFSYFGYSAEGYEHPMLWIAIEYLVVLMVATFEFSKRKKLLNYV